MCGIFETRNSDYNLRWSEIDFIRTCPTPPVLD